MNKTATEFRRKTGELPDILKEGRVFKVIIQPPEKEHKRYTTRYTSMLYKYTNAYMAAGDRSISNMYYKYFNSPEKHVNKAFLHNHRRNQAKWHRIVNAMEAAMVRTLKAAVNDCQTNMHWFADKEEELSQYLEKYLETHKILPYYEEKNL